MAASVEVNEQGHLLIGGVDAVKLAEEYGTPLIAYDVRKIKKQIRGFKQAFEDAGVKYMVSYASKAFSALAMYQLINKYGLGCDIVSGGELYTALKGGMTPERIEFHGNNKLQDELEMAVDEKIGTIVVDNFREIKLLDHVLRRKHASIGVVLRVTPGIEAETHQYIMTGQSNSKFGFDIRSGQAEEALQQLMKNPRMNLMGIHCHIGSQIFAVNGFLMAAEKLVEVLADWKKRFGYEADVLNLGGGFGIRYNDFDQPLPAEEFVSAIVERVKELVTKYELKMPEIIIEPAPWSVKPQRRFTRSVREKTSTASATFWPLTAEWATTSALRFTMRITRHILPIVRTRCASRWSPLSASTASRATFWSMTAPCRTPSRETSWPCRRPVPTVIRWPQTTTAIRGLPSFFAKTASQDSLSEEKRMPT